MNSTMATTNRARLIIMSGVLLGLLLSALDQTIVSTAMPRIIADLGGLSYYSWVFTAYLLTSTAAVPIFGKLSDLYGRKPFYMGGIVLFLAASGLCGLAQSMPMLIILRGVQGIGGGIIAGGRPVSGYGGYGGEVGHMIVNPNGKPCICGASGCWMTEVGEHALLSAADRAVLAQLAEGSIGRALELAGAGGIGLYRSLVRLLDGLPEIDGAALHALADRLQRADGEEAFRLLAELLPGWLARMVALAAGGADAALPEESQAMRRLAARRGLDQWVEVWEKLTHLFAQADSVNLDRKQVVLNAFFALAEAAR